MADDKLIRRIARLSDEGDLNHLTYDLVVVARAVLEEMGDDDTNPLSMTAMAALVEALSHFDERGG